MAKPIYGRLSGCFSCSQARHARDGSHRVIRLFGMSQQARAAFTSPDKQRVS